MLKERCFSLGRSRGEDETSRGAGPQANAKRSMSLGGIFAGGVVANLSSSIVIFSCSREVSPRGLAFSQG